MPTAELTTGEKLYRIGVNTNCPVHQIFAGGQCWPRRSQKVTGYGAETKRIDLRGAIVIMQEGQLEKCFESMEHKVIRMTKGRKARAQVHDTRNPRYTKMERDVPVADYTWFEEVETLNNPYEPIAKATVADYLKAKATAPSAGPPEADKRGRGRRGSGASAKE